MSLPFVLLAFILSGAPEGYTDVNKKITFLGFSANEAASAWKADTVEQTPTGATISFSIIRIVRSSTNEVVASFRASPMVRGPGGNRRAPLPSMRALEQAHPEWAAAMPASKWGRYKRRIGFKAIQLIMNDAALRLAADEDTNAYMSASKKCIQVTTKHPGDPMGFQPVARLMDGNLMSLGHFRIEGQPGQNIRGCVEVKMSKSGYHLAVLALLEVQQGSGPWQPRPIASVTALPEAIGATQLGTMNMMLVQGRLLQKNIAEINPAMEETYTTYIGTYW